jgi:hypothetical protein
VRELGQRGREPRPPDRTPRAHDVRPDIHLHASANAATARVIPAGHALRLSQLLALVRDDLTEGNAHCATPASLDRQTP